MKQFFLKLTGLFFIALLCAAGTFAQDTTNHTSTLITPPLFSGNHGFRKWSIGVHAGVMAPFAATGGSNDFSKWLPDLGYGGYIKYQLSHSLGIQADFLRGTLKANNDKLERGAIPVSPYQSFKTDIHWATSLSGVLTLGNINWSQLRTFIQPYITLGGGAINFNPKMVNDAGTTVDYQSGSVTKFYIPVGIGIKANLSRGVNLDLGYTMAYVDADNLDGYEKGPAFNNDKFSYAHLGLEFSLGKSNRPQLARHNPPAQLAQNMRDENNAMRASLAASEERYNQRLAEVALLKDDLDKMKMDSDGDGVSDYFDKCPGTAMGVKVDGSGCPLPMPPVKDTLVKVYNNTYVVTEEDKKIVSEAIRNLEFVFGKATISQKSFPYLNRVADMLVKKGFSLKLAGHTDNVGSDAANMRLSKDRAESVKNYLVAQGADGARIEAVGYGETQPISSNKTAAGRQKNRRVEFTLY